MEPLHRATATEAVGAEAGRFHPRRGQHCPREAHELVIGDSRPQLRTRPQPGVLPRAIDAGGAPGAPARSGGSPAGAPTRASCRVRAPQPRSRGAYERSDYGAEGLEGEIQQAQEPRRGALGEGTTEYPTSSSRKRAAPRAAPARLERGVRFGPEGRAVGQTRTDDHVPERALLQAVEAQAAITHDGGRRRASRLSAAKVSPGTALCGAGARAAHQPPGSPW